MEVFQHWQGRRWLAGIWLGGLLVGTAVPLEAGGRVALTFDDGPRPFFTEKALDLLDQYGAAATFFYVGQMLLYYPQLAKMVAARGHEIENHTFSHPYLTRLSPAQIRDQLLRTNALIARQTGYQPRYIRLPYNAVNGTVHRIVEQLGLKVVPWTIDPRDWQRNRTPPTIVRQVMSRVKDGSIILLHETRRTLRALPPLLRQLRQLGFRLVTIAELLEEEDLESIPQGPQRSSPLPEHPRREISERPSARDAPSPTDEGLVLDHSARPVVKIHCGKGGQDEVELAPDYSYELVRGQRRDYRGVGPSPDRPQWSWYGGTQVQFRLLVPPGSGGVVNVYLPPAGSEKGRQKLFLNRQYVGEYRSSRWVGVELDEGTTRSGSLLVRAVGVGMPACISEVVFEVEEPPPPFLNRGAGAALSIP